MTDLNAEKLIPGIPASGGIAIGQLVILGKQDELDRVSGEPEEEKQLLTRALDAARESLERIISDESALAGDILEFQVALIEDDDLTAPVFAKIEQGMPAHKSWASVLDREIAEYRAGDDDYMSARADDLVDLKRRVLAAIHETTHGPVALPRNAILITEDMTPSQFLEQDWSELAGAAIMGGSPTSHVAILARARNINLIVGLHIGDAVLKDGMSAILDAANGNLICEPGPESLAAATDRAEAVQAEMREAESMAAEPARTADGELVHVMLNVDDPSALSNISPELCDGVGLTRTEFLFEGKALPDEDTQYAAYAAVVRWADGRPVTLRTLDAGGDKPIQGVTIDGEQNPFLGMRGARLSLNNPLVLKVQLRAMARAAALGPVKVMIPMITVPQELEAVRNVLTEALAELKAGDIVHASPQLGIMVEVPAAALMAERFDADFYSIGSNDLTQYTVAAARDNPALAYLAEPASPAVLELVSRTVAAGRKRGAEVSLCGEMASQPDKIPALLAAGLRVFSVSPALIGRVKQCIRRYDSTVKDESADG